MRSTLACLLVAASAVSGLGQEVRLPAEIRGAVGAWVVVAPEVISGGKPKWRYDAGLTEVRLDLLFRPEIAEQARGKVFTSTVDGRFKVEVWNALDDVPSDITTCWVIVGKLGPAPAPPADPDDPVKPEPPVSPPAPTALRVLALFQKYGGP